MQHAQRWKLMDIYQSQNIQHRIAGVVIHRENNSAVFAFGVVAHPSKFVAWKCPQIPPCSPTLSTSYHQGRLGGSCRNYSDFGSSRTRGDPFSPLESRLYHQISSWDRKRKLRTFFLLSAKDQVQRIFSMELWGHFPRGIRASRNVQWAWLVLPAKQWHSTNATRHPNVTTKLESFCERKWEEARVRTKIDWILWTCSASCANYYLFRWEVSRFTFEIDHALNAPQGESGVQVNEVDFPLATDSCRAFEMTALSLSRVHPPPR